MADMIEALKVARERHQFTREQAIDEALTRRLDMPADDLSPELREERIAYQQQRERWREDNKRRECVRGLISGAGQKYEDCRLRTFEATTPYQSKVVAHLQQYVDDFADHLAANEGLILYGPVGTGKDHLAFSVAGAAAWNGMLKSKWVNGQSWFGRVRDAMDKDTTEAELISEMERPDILVLSDPLPPIGPLSQHQATMLYRLIDARYSQKNKVTIVTVNVADDQEADERIGAPTWDRICHNALKINCRWATYRKPKLVITPNK